MIAGLNILAFELSPRTKALVAQIGPGDNTPLRLKLAGGILSLVVLSAVLRQDAPIHRQCVLKIEQIKNGRPLKARGNASRRRQP